MYDSSPYRQTPLETARRYRRAKTVLDAVQGQQPPGYAPGIAPPNNGGALGNVGMPANAKIAGRGPQPDQNPAPGSQDPQGPSGSPYAPSS